MFIMCFHGYADSTTLGNASRAHRWLQMNVSQVHHGLSEGIKMRQIDRLGRDCMNIENNICELAKPSEPRSMCHATCICVQKIAKTRHWSLSMCFRYRLISICSYWNDGQITMSMKNEYKMNARLNAPEEISTDLWGSPHTVFLIKPPALKKSDIFYPRSKGSVFFTEENRSWLRGEIFRDATSAGRAS